MVQSNSSVSTRTREGAPSPAQRGAGSTWVGYSISSVSSVSSVSEPQVVPPADARTWPVLGVSCVAGAWWAATSGAQPTGLVSVDIVYLALAGMAFPVVARQSGRWATLMGTGALALFFSSPQPLRLVLLAGVVVAFVLASTIRPALRPWLLPPAGAALFGLLLRSGDFGVSRLSALVVLAVWLVMMFSAIRSSTGRLRGLLEVVSVSVMALLALGAINTGVVLASARGNIESAGAALESGLGATSPNDIDEAHEALVQARSNLKDARYQLDSVWAAPGRYVPVVSQNYRALEASLEAIDRTAIAGIRAVEAADISEFRSVEGGFNLARLTAVEQATSEFRQSLVVTADVLSQLASPWLASPLVDRLDNASVKAADAVVELDESLPYLTQLPSLLGADQPRRYLVMASNPNETRELGGFHGGFAVLEFVNGNITLVDAGRSTDLNLKPSSLDQVSSILPDRFGHYEPWTYAQNYTGTHDLAVAANVIRDLFVDMGPTSEPLDGVIYLDPYALGALIELSGPIEVGGIGLTLDQDTLPQFLLTKQYELIDDRNARTTVLNVVLESVFSQLQSSDLQDFDTIVDVLSPMIDQGRLRMVSFDAADNQLLDDLGLAARFRPEAFDDFLSVSHANAGPNKLDVYMHRSVRYDITTSESTGNDRPSAQATVEVTLDNRTPAGLDEYVISNRHDLAFGTNRMLLIVHTPLEAQVVSAEGQIMEVESYYEYGLWRHEVFVAIPRGESATVLFELAGTLGASAADPDPSSYDLWVHHQPTATTDDYEVTVNGVLQRFELTMSAMHRWD